MKSPLQYKYVYGLIGYPLVHSFSLDYFNQKFLAEDIDAIYLKDVSYLRLKSIILSYSLPKITFNLSLGNFLTLTAYDGMDPEVPGATYPTTRSVSFGINVQL